ncbi:MAG: hypothetical protein N2C14_12010 [Planctomycetales bacterium]
MTLKHCPDCGLQHPEDSTGCGCGHRFQDAAINEPPSDRKSRRTRYRWLVSIGFTALGVAFWGLAPNVVIRGTPVPFGAFPLIVGVIGLFGCATGLNVFWGGGLDPRDD